MSSLDEIILREKDIIRQGKRYNSKGKRYNSTPPSMEKWGRKKPSTFRLQPLQPQNDFFAKIFCQKIVLSKKFAQNIYFPRKARKTRTLSAFFPYQARLCRALIIALLRKALLIRE